MVGHNRPWRLVPSLDRAIATAAAAAAFPIFYSTLWAMANASSPSRLALINLLAICAMVTWLVAHNRLWNRRRGFRADPHPALYNLSTCLTVFIGVCCMYALLFAITTIAAGIVIAPGYLSHALHHPAGPIEYLKIAWLASSMGTVAGALGQAPKPKPPYAKPPTPGGSRNDGSEHTPRIRTSTNKLRPSTVELSEFIRACPVLDHHHHHQPKNVICKEYPAWTERSTVCTVR